MSSTEYTALAAIDEEAWAAHKARVGERTTLVLEEGTHGWVVSIYRAGYRLAKRSTIRVSDPVEAMRRVEQGAGRLLRWEQRYEELVVRDWRPLEEDERAAHYCYGS
jgi:hypothetical protein